MRWGAIWLLAAWGLCGPAGPGRAQEADYEISHYDVILTLSDGSPDAEVELDITYDVRSGVKYSGFKYTGDFQPVEVSAVDERGERLPAGVRREREYQVWWTFPPVRRGSQRVIVRFRLREALSGTRADGNALAAPWISVFGVPVRRAAYTVVFPPGFTPELEGRGARGFTQRRAGRQEMLTLTQEPLRQKGLSLRFRPGLVDWRAQAEGTTPLDLWPLAVFLGAGLGGVGLFRAARGGQWRGSGWSGGCGGGGCGGGGCGGGGCGGGCGG